MSKVPLLALAIFTWVPGPLSAAPTVATAGIRNSASSAHPLFPNGSIAQGSLFVVYGSAMGPGQVQFAGGFPLPSNLSGTSISVTVSGGTLSCPMVFTSAFQLAAILPSNTPLGTGTLVVSYNGLSNAAPIKVVTSSPGIFTVNQQGSGPGVIQDGLGRQNTLTFAFNPGQTVVIWGTGLGPISGSDANAPPSGNLPGVTVTANVGGQNAKVVYAGRSSDAGLDQINITLPAGVTGCYVPIYLVATPANGAAVTSNFVTASIASTGSVCSDPNYPGITSSSGYHSGNVTLMERTISNTTNRLNFPPDDSGTGSFTVMDPAALATVGSFSFLDLPNGSCAVIQGNGSSGPAMRYIDGGALLNVNGPNGANQLRYSVGTYSAIFSPVIGGPAVTPPYLPPGTYTIDNGIGGADVGPFKRSITIPPPFMWNEFAKIASLDRSKPLAITWSGGDPNAQVQVLGTSVADESLDNYMSFVCVGRGSDFMLTVPAAVLSLLPPSAVFSLGGMESSLAVTSTTSVTSPASGLDSLTVTASYTFTTFQMIFK